MSFSKTKGGGGVGGCGGYWTPPPLDTGVHASCNANRVEFCYLKTWISQTCAASQGVELFVTLILPWIPQTNIT